MTRRTNFPWAVVGVTMACLIGASMLPDEDWPLATILAAGVAIMIASASGALIATRKRSNPVGWILLAAGLSMSSLFVTTQYANRALVDAPGSLPGGIVAAWLQAWVAVPILSLVAFLFLLFPTGRTIGPRWRWVGRLSVIGSGVAVLSMMFRPGPLETFPTVRNPLGIQAAPFLRSLFELGQITSLLAILLAAISVVRRFRRANASEREQMKWFAFAVVASVALFLLNPLLFLALGVDEPPLFLGFLLPLLGATVIPVSIATAILRYRLYDIDRIISRTVSYSVVTLILAGVFALFALGPALVVGTGSSGAPDYVIAAATLVVAALFRPVRRRVQRAVDHRFNRSRYDAVRTIDAFAARLREQTDIDTLGAELRGLVASTMHPSHVSLWVRPPTRRA